MSVITPDRRHSRAYTKTVSMPVSKKAHHPQLPLTPCSRTRPVTRLGVSVENVVATMLMPSSHQGMLRPARKNPAAEFPTTRDAQMPTPRANKKYAPMMAQSSAAISMQQG